MPIRRRARCSTAPRRASVPSWRWAIPYSQPIAGPRAASKRAQPSSAAANVSAVRSAVVSASRLRRQKYADSARTWRR